MSKIGLVWEYSRDILDILNIEFPDQFQYEDKYQLSFDLKYCSIRPRLIVDLHSDHTLSFTGVNNGCVTSCLSRRGVTT